MPVPSRFFVFLLILFGISTPGFAQGGFGGGGFSGGRSGLGNPEADTAGVEPQTDAEVSIRRNILTPGQYVEYPLTVSAGDVILADAITANFDSALQVTDAAGKVLAENDDARPGEQNARLFFRFSVAGSYKLLVRAFKGAAGGQFELRLRRFSPKEIRLGEPITERDPAPMPYYYRFTATENQKILVNVRSIDESGVRLFSATGETVTPLRRIRSGTWRFEIKQSGEYYLRTLYPQSVSVMTMTPMDHALGEISAEKILKPGEGDRWRFTGKAGQMILVRPTSTSPIRSQLNYVYPSGEASFSENFFWQLGNNPKDTNAFNGILLRSGSYEISVLAPTDREVRYRLVSTFPAKEWKSRELTGNLSRGGIDDFLVTAKAGELLHIDASSELFDGRLEIFDLKGKLLFHDDDSGGERNARITGIVPEAGTYLLRVFSQGYGGGGKYRLKRVPLSPRPLTIGKKETGVTRPGEPEVWSFSGKAGQTLLLNVRSTDFFPVLNVYNPEASLTGRSGGGNDDNRLMIVKVPKDGTYTLWVSRPTGMGTGEETSAGTYTVKLLDAD